MIAERLIEQATQAIEEHRTNWLRQAELTLKGLDPRDGGRIRVLDFTELGAPPTGYLGFVAGAELHELARGHVEIGDGTTAAVAVNVDRIANLTASDDPEEISAAVSVVAAHELAHLLDARAAGRRLAHGTTLATVLAFLESGQATAVAKTPGGHSPGWLRAYVHLLVRAAGQPHYRTWAAGFIRDVSAVLPRAPGEYLDAMQPEILSYRRDVRLVEILRSPAPAGFLSLFHQ